MVDKFEIVNGYDAKAAVSAGDLDAGSGERTPAPLQGLRRGHTPLKEGAWRLADEVTEPRMQRP